MAAMNNHKLLELNDRQIYGQMQMGVYRQAAMEHKDGYTHVLAEGSAMVPNYLLIGDW